MSKLAIFGFDGTIYRGDSMRDYARFLNPVKYYISLIKLLGPYIQFLSGNGSRDQVKALFLQSNFAGYSEEELHEKGRQFFEKNRAKCYVSALNWIQTEQTNGTRLVILSGSCRPWLLPFAEHFNADLICTELEYDEHSKSTGKWKAKNLTGKAKKEALKNYLKTIDQPIYSIAFGNQKSDALSGELADEYRENYFH